MLMRALRCGGEADYPNAIAIADELIGQGSSDPATEILAHVVRLAAHLHRGDFAAAEVAYAHAVVVSARETLEQEAAIVAMMYDSLRSWLIGRPDRALADTRAMLARADAARSPTLSMLAQLAIARLHYLRRDPADETIAAALLVLDNPIEDRSSHEEAAMLIRAVGGRVERDAVHPPRIGASVIPPVAIGRTVTALAAVEVLRQSQHHEQAERLVDEVLEFASRHDERVVEAELLCQRGRILADRDREAALGAFQAAIASARAIDALTLELRATTELARFLPAPERAPWLARLSALIARHSEGHETHDVRDARALIR
jgi:tetratricopeptide (TPR) repeat protein